VQRLGLGDGFSSIACLAHDLYIALGGEQRTDALADDGVIIGIKTRIVFWP